MNLKEKVTKLKENRLKKLSWKVKEPLICIAECNTCRFMYLRICRSKMKVIFFLLRYSNISRCAVWYWCLQNNFKSNFHDVPLPTIPLQWYWKIYFVRTRQLTLWPVLNFLILFWLMPDDFTSQRVTSHTGRCKLKNCSLVWLPGSEMFLCHLISGPPRVFL